MKIFFINVLFDKAVNPGSWFCAFVINIRKKCVCLRVPAVCVAKQHVALLNMKKADIGLTSIRLWSDYGVFCLDQFCNRFLSHKASVIICSEMMITLELQEYRKAVCHRQRDIKKIFPTEICNFSSQTHMGSSHSLFLHLSFIITHTSSHTLALFQK